MIAISEFYDRLFQDPGYASSCYADAERPGLVEFVKRFGLDRAVSLDIGCGRGWFQHLSENWVGLDASAVAGRHVKGRFICGTAEAIPLKDRSVDAIWSITFLEHSPKPEQALFEMSRVLVDGGVLYLAPAWRVPPWRPKGYETREYHELDWRHKAFKWFLPLLNLVWMKGIFWIPSRFWHEVGWTLSKKPKKLRYTAFEPNLEEYLLPDSDARNSLDSHAVLLWFLSRGFAQPVPTNWLDRVLMRCGPLTLRKEFHR